MKTDYKYIRFEQGIDENRWVCIHKENGNRGGVVIIQDHPSQVPIIFVPDTGCGFGPCTLAEIIKFMKQLKI